MMIFKMIITIVIIIAVKTTMIKSIIIAVVIINTPFQPGVFPLDPPLTYNV